MAKVRALLLESNAPMYLQGKAVLAIVYIYNRTPYSSLGFKTLYEVTYNIKPNINNIRIQGSIVYYKIKGLNNYKLKLQVEQGILIGYGQDSYNYKIFNIYTKRVLQSRNVKILKGKFINPNKITNIPPVFKEEQEGIQIDEFTTFPIKEHNNNP